ncbi:GmrSD restriction endonuclease domain-containing protein [Bdellovibrio bacteriovorus]|uniref:GmrSD restriction endonuclease domain-containing protein n=1 Tax=Bdellovibrio bacteriovorus TaxID=959 RepID=UPI003A7F7FB2
MSRRNVTFHTIRIEDIIEGVKAGTLAIPEFQRDYVWQKNKAPKLLDSLLNQFPIGAILTWSTDDNVESRIRTRVKSPTKWIIDGQQRTSTLVKIMDGDIHLLFDVENESFLLENAATKKAMNPFHVPVSDIWGPRYTKILKEIGDLTQIESKARQFEDRVASCRNLLYKELPQIHLEGHGIDDAIQAFQRINTQGMRLKSTDIEVAELTKRHAGFVKNSVQPYLNKLKSRGWDRVYLSQLFMACEGIAEDSVKSDQRKRLHDLSKSQLERSWNILTKGVDDAIEFLNDELGIKDSGIFPSGSMLMPLAILMSKPIKLRPDAQDLVRWMIAASITRRYSGSSSEKLDKDIQSCFSSNPIRSLVRNAQKDSGRSSLRANPQNFSGALHDRYGMFLTYLACRSSGMKDLFDKRQVSSSTAEWHHVIPRASIALKHRRELDVPANIAFILGPTNRSISNSKAESYLENIDDALLKSQCIPTDRRIWSSHKEFIKKRGLLLAKAINEY